jgi:hypothetical protein
VSVVGLLAARSKSSMRHARPPSPAREPSRAER